MGLGVNLVCNQCHKKDSLLLGCGFNSFMNGFKNVVFVCKRCGYWETAEVPLDKNDDKLDIPSEEEMTTGKTKFICPTCNIRMKKYEKYYNQKNESVIPKMKCAECGGLLEGHGNICWD